MTNIATVTCTRLEPPVTWLAASGAKVKVLHSGGCTKDERTNPKLQKSCSSVIEVSVSRNFAESSLSALRSKGFTREDIYRMLDKGPWILSFDIPTALPKLFLSLQVRNEINNTESHLLLSYLMVCIYNYYYISNDFTHFVFYRTTWDCHNVKQYMWCPIVRISLHNMQNIRAEMFLPQ